jgi:hypothetical protein
MKRAYLERHPTGLTFSVLIPKFGSESYSKRLLAIAIDYTVEPDVTCDPLTFLAFCDRRRLWLSRVIGEERFHRIRLGSFS